MWEKISMSGVKSIEGREENGFSFQKCTPDFDNYEKVTKYLLFYIYSMFKGNILIYCIKSILFK